MIPLFKVGCRLPEAVVAYADVLASGYIGQGPVVDRFEAELAKVLGVEPWQVVTVNSGTSAIELALQLAGVVHGNWVVVSPVTCMADAHAVLNAGGVIDWCETRSDGLIDWDDAKARCGANTRAVISTDLGGLSCGGFSLPCRIIQDAAQNFTGPMYGDFVCLSFQAIKHLTTGDGGAVIVRTSKKDADKARLLRWFGLDRTSSADFRCEQNIRTRGFKWHMSDIAASLGIANLPHALEAVRRSRDNARYYQSVLPPEVTIWWHDLGTYWLYQILVPERARFMERMTAAGIHVSPVHAIGTKHDQFPKAALPVAEAFCARNVAIPNGFWVTEQDREFIAAEVVKALRD